MDRTNLALHARQVKAAERAVANAKLRMKVAQEQLDINLFSITAGPNDPLMVEFLQRERRAVLDCLRAEPTTVRQPPSTPRAQFGQSAMAVPETMSIDEIKMENENDEISTEDRLDEISTENEE
jgi:hypothetical protein